MLEKDLLYADLTDKVINCAFTVFRALGPGLKEKVYQNALSIEFKKANIKFSSEKYLDINYSGVRIGQRYLDFLVEDILVVEIKVRDAFIKSDFDQVYEYLKANNLKLGLILLLTRSGFRIKRVANLYN